VDPIQGVHVAVNVYDLLRLLVDSSDISEKTDAHELITELQGMGAFGSAASVVSAGEQAGHVHIPQQEWENELHQRLVDRCGTCRMVLSEPRWPDSIHRYDSSQGNYGKRKW
jgi:hypothetical protein